jgi:hypothetical protein
MNFEAFKSFQPFKTFKPSNNQGIVLNDLNVLNVAIGCLNLARRFSPIISQQVGNRAKLDIAGVAL